MGWQRDLVVSLVEPNPSRCIRQAGAGLTMMMRVVGRRPKQGLVSPGVSVIPVARRLKTADDFDVLMY
jgi:hypothetical protein